MGSLLKLLFVAGAGAVGYRQVAGASEKQSTTLISPALALGAGVGAYFIIKKLRG